MVDGLILGLRGLERSVSPWFIGNFVHLSGVSIGWSPYLYPAGASFGRERG